MTWIRSHDVARGGKLDFLFSGFIGAINRLSDAIAEPGDSLAQAIRERKNGNINPEILARLEQIDASINHFADVLKTITTDQATLDALREKLKQTTDSVQAAVEDAKGE